MTPRRPRKSDGPNDSGSSDGSPGQATQRRRLSLPRRLSHSVLENADLYIEAGWYVLPVAAGSSDPASLLGPDWAKRSTRKPSKVRKWWAKWPDASLALDLARSRAVAFRPLDDAPEPPSVEFLMIMARASSLRAAGCDQSTHVLALEGDLSLQSGDYGPFEGEATVLCAGEIVTLPSTDGFGDDEVYRWRPAGRLEALPQDLERALLAAGEQRRPIPDKHVAAERDAPGASATAARAPRRHALRAPVHQGSTWAPKELSSLVEGAFEPLEASLMRRTDGVGLLYPGMVHTFFGEPESGKSLLLQWACVDALEGGLDVLYIDFESDEQSILRRLMALRARPKRIQKRFTYVRPEADLSSDKDSKMWQQLLARSFDLAVIDGVTESLDLFGFKSTDNDNVARWMRTVPRELAARTGAAVALIDHVTKSREGRGRFPVGAQAKLSAITGAAYSVQTTQRLVGGRHGEFLVRMAKDRPGGIVRHALSGTGRLPMIARARITPHAEAGLERTLAVDFEPPGHDEHSTSSGDGDRDVDQSILDTVSTHPGLTQTKLLKRLGGNRPTSTARLNHLEAQGQLRVEAGPRSSKMYHPA